MQSELEAQNGISLDLDDIALPYNEPVEWGEGRGGGGGQGQQQRIKGEAAEQNVSKHFPRQKEQYSQIFEYDGATDRSVQGWFKLPSCRH